MINKETIANLVEESLDGTDLFLVEVKVKPSNIIEVYVDADSAVNIDQCVTISRYVESHLDRDAEDFELSVYSWGLSGVVKLPRQFAKYLNKEVEVKTKDQGRVSGTMTAYDEQQVTIDGNRVFALNQVKVYPAIKF